MTVYYNENEPYCVEWLQNLIREKLIAHGDIDARDIRDVYPNDLRGYDQCHFFAGLGGWSRALRLAGWGDRRAVWTGSCPCQPFSAAGKLGGFADERHLWPFWYHLIAQCRPAVVFGEQVARAHDWLALVRSDLEAVGYAVGAMPVEAASVGANHKRDRYWFVADAAFEHVNGSRQSRPRGGVEPADGGNVLADTDASRSPERREPQLLEQRQAALGSGWWAVEPDVGRVAHGIPGRVGRLRAYGNAIVPQVAAEFIKAASDP